MCFSKLAVVYREGNQPSARRSPRPRHQAWAHSQPHPASLAAVPTAMPQHPPLRWGKPPTDTLTLVHASVAIDVRCHQKCNSLQALQGAAEPLEPLAPLSGEQQHVLDQVMCAPPAACTPLAMTPAAHLHLHSHKAGDYQRPRQNMWQRDCCERRAGRSGFFTGCAGNGKSLLLRHI